MKRPKVSIIIVNFNGEEIISDCLNSVYKQTFRDFEVIIVDNDSSDSSCEFIKKTFPIVRLFELKKNLGFAQGNNFGYKKALGGYVFLLNPDTVLGNENCLELLLEGFSDIKIGAQAPKIIFEFDKSRLDSVGTEFDNLGFNWGRGFREKDDKKFNKHQEVFGATACAMMFRKKIIKPPLFDPSFFMYYEELELSIRIREQGYKIICNPKAVIYHKLSATQNKKPSFAPTPFKQYFANINRTKIYFKYFPGEVILRNLFLFMTSLVYWNIFFLKQKNINYFFKAPFLEVKSAIMGLRERKKSDKPWIKFMVYHTLDDLLNRTKEKKK